MTDARVRVLIVDDEPLARETLRLLMRDDAAIEIVGECGSGRDAVEAIVRLAPDLVFLDVQMPELDGFQTLARLGLAAERRPIVVFVTAYDRYALKAFDAHALDYLVKPFTDERFYAALDRAKAHVRQRAFGEVGERMLSLLRAQGFSEATMPAAASVAAHGEPAAHAPGSARTPHAAGAASTSGMTAGMTSVPMPPPATASSTTASSTAASSTAASSRPLDRIAVKSEGRVTFVRTADVDWIEACDDYIRVHAGSTSHELRQPLKELAARLDGRRFVRIHRSAIVNLDRVQELQPHFNGSYVVVLKNGATLPISRARREELRAALGLGNLLP